MQCPNQPTQTTGYRVWWATLGDKKMIDALIQEIQDLANHIGLSILFLSCLLVYVIHSRYSKRNGFGIIVTCLIVFIGGLVTSAVADSIFDKVLRKMSISISLVSEREGILMQRSRLLESISAFMRFCSAVTVFCWTLWITSKSLLCLSNRNEN